MKVCCVIFSILWYNKITVRGAEDTETDSKQQLARSTTRSAEPPRKINLRKESKQMKEYRFKITYIDDDGEQKTVTVTARHEFEAKQVAHVFNKTIISIVNQDL